MVYLPGTVASAVGAFTVTNIDDFVLLVILFIDSQTGGLPPSYIVVGQYLGFAALLAISGAAAVGLVVVPARWVGLLGLLPLMVSVRGFIKASRHRTDLGERSVARNSLLSVTVVTIANGGDNVAVYVLMFHAQTLTDAAITVIVFLLLLAFWCAGAALIGTYGRLVSALTRVGQWLVPVVYLIIGIMVLASSGVLVRLAQLIIR